MLFHALAFRLPSISNVVSFAVSVVTYNIRT